MQIHSEASSGGYLPMDRSGYVTLERGQVFESSRVFGLEEILNAHTQLIIRSPRKPDYPSRIELLFADVEYLSVRTGFDGIRVWRLEEGSAEDTDVLSRARRKRYEGTTVHRVDTVIDGEPLVGYIISGPVQWRESAVREWAGPSPLVRST